MDDQQPVSRSGALAEALVCLLYMQTIPSEERPHVAAMGVARLRRVYNLQPLFDTLEKELAEMENALSE